MSYHLGREAIRLFETSVWERWNNVPNSLFFFLKNNKGMGIYPSAFWAPVDACLFYTVHTVPVLGAEDFTYMCGTRFLCFQIAVLLAKVARDCAESCRKASSNSILLLPALPVSQGTPVNCCSPFRLFHQCWMKLTYLQLFKEKNMVKNTWFLWKWDYCLDWKPLNFSTDSFICERLFSLCFQQ